jgi:hypothetical protein
MFKYMLFYDTCRRMNVHILRNHVIPWYIYMHICMCMYMLLNMHRIVFMILNIHLSEQLYAYIYMDAYMFHMDMCIFICICALGI